MGVLQLSKLVVIFRSKLFSWHDNSIRPSLKCPNTWVCAWKQMYGFSDSFWDLSIHLKKTNKQKKLTKPNNN